MMLKYRNEFDDYLNHFDLMNPHSYKNSRNTYYASLALPIIIGFAGIGGSWNENPFISCLIIAALSYYLYSVLPYSKAYRRSIHASIKPLPEKDIRLEVNDTGFVEHVDGVQSFCPWSSMVGFQLFRETLFIELKPFLWAIIPAGKLSQDSPPLTDLTNLLRKNGVSEKTKPVGPANAAKLRD